MASEATPKPTMTSSLSTRTPPMENAPMASSSRPGTPSLRTLEFPANDLRWVWSCLVGLAGRVRHRQSGNHRRSHQLIERAVQVGRRNLDVGILSLGGPHLRGDDATPVHVLKVTVGKLVSGLAVFRILIVEA